MFSFLLFLRSILNLQESHNLELDVEMELPYQAADLWYLHGILPVRVEDGPAACTAADPFLA